MPSLPKPRLRRNARATELVAPPEPGERQPQVETVEADGLRWVNIQRPTPLESAWLEEQFDFHALDLEDVLSRNQRPKIDEYPDYLFIVLHFPVFDRAVKRLNAGELDIFVGRDFLVTIPNQPLQPVEYLFERCRQKEELREQLFSRGSGYLLYRIVDDSFDYCFPMLRKIGNKLDALEDEIFEGRSEDIVRDISNVEAGDHQLPQGDPSAAHRPARPREARAALPRPRGRRARDLLRRHRRRPRADLGHARELQGGRSRRSRTRTSRYISHRVNDILRVLTSISVIVLPLTLIASVWGMNVGVPGEGDPTDFYVIVGAMVVLLLGMVAYFRQRGWL